MSNQAPPTHRKRPSFSFLGGKHNPFGLGLKKATPFAPHDASTSTGTVQDDASVTHTNDDSSANSNPPLFATPRRPRLSWFRGMAHKTAASVSPTHLNAIPNVLQIDGVEDSVVLASLDNLPHDVQTRGQLQGLDVGQLQEVTNVINGRLPDSMQLPVHDGDKSALCAMLGDILGFQKPVTPQAPHRLSISLQGTAPVQPAHQLYDGSTITPSAPPSSPLADRSTRPAYLSVPSSPVAYDDGSDAIMADASSSQLDFSRDLSPSENPEANIAHDDISHAFFLGLDGAASPGRVAGERMLQSLAAFTQASNPGDMMDVDEATAPAPPKRTLHTVMEETRSEEEDGSTVYRRKRARNSLPADCSSHVTAVSTSTKGLRRSNTVDSNAVSPSGVMTRAQARRDARSGKRVTRSMTASTSLDADSSSSPTRITRSHSASVSSSGGNVSHSSPKMPLKSTGRRATALIGGEQRQHSLHAAAHARLNPVLLPPSLQISDVVDEVVSSPLLYSKPSRPEFLSATSAAELAGDLMQEPALDFAAAGSESVTESSSNDNMYRPAAAAEPCKHQRELLYNTIQAMRSSHSDEHIAEVVGPSGTGNDLASAINSFTASPLARLDSQSSGQVSVTEAHTFFPSRIHSDDRGSSGEKDSIHQHPIPFPTFATVNTQSPTPNTQHGISGEIVFDPPFESTPAARPHVRSTINSSEAEPALQESPTKYTRTAFDKRPVGPRPLKSRHSLGNSVSADTQTPPRRSTRMSIGS
ncbi:hypothetical protein BKA62DRAFT_683087 [Auriculariales sp. MPI-PUGE-AT-0066]|nr:hypothetical protein BKA62DRAFT_683087 [Auriculariales sp. MPI-PUGE-AT-0066]